MIEAQDILVQMRLADFPNMKSEERSRWHREIYRQAYPSQKKPEAMTTQELATFLKARLHG